jgi:serine/threonine protein kinase
VVAIKVLPPSRAKSSQMLARFQREARLSLKLKHPNVVRSYQLGESKGVHYLVMECLEGEPLDEVLARRKRLPPAEAVRLIHQALLGLQHIHEQGLVHRDLKPANLMLIAAKDSEGSATTLHATAKILDIGLAREFYDESVAPGDTERMELTAEGVLLGTPDYLAPEQARDPRTIDIRADVYSLGCTLYHLLTGQPPFPDKNILNQMIRHATETAKPLHELDATIPEGLTQIVNWMMAKKPEERYPTPARAAQALEAFLMVTSESGNPAEEQAPLPGFLTWLETEEKSASGTRPASSPNIPAAPPAKGSSGSRGSGSGTKSNPNIAVPVPKAPSNPNIQLPAPKPAKPSEKAPAPSLPAAPPLESQIDVELVPLPISPPSPGAKPTLRDFLMIGLGVVLMLMSCGCYNLVWFVFKMFTESE